MLIKLKHELIINSYKTIDGRGANVHITGNGCLTLQYVSHVIIHNIHIHNCKPSGNTLIASSPTHVGFRGKSDGDGISITGSISISFNLNPKINFKKRKMTKLALCRIAEDMDRSLRVELLYGRASGCDIGLDGDNSVEQLLFTSQ